MNAMMPQALCYGCRHRLRRLLHPGMRTKLQGQMMPLGGLDCSSRENLDYSYHTNKMQKC
jgi:hypothetical protein